jgi:hypothetical protein
MESKQVQVKVDDEGSVKAVFATLKVVDKDKDFTESGAFKKGQAVIMSDFNHGAIPRFGFPGRPPVGKGTIEEVGDDAIFSGKFFLDTVAGLDAYRTTKAVGDLQEWSYHYEVLQAEQGMKDGKPVRLLKSLDVFEVSPVYRGAGEGTRTVSLKYADDFAEVLDAVRGIVERTKGRKTFRLENGRDLSRGDRTSIMELVKMSEELKELLESEADLDALAGTAAGLIAQYEQLMKATEGY